MSGQLSLGNVDFELGTLTSFAPRKAKDNTPFCVAVLSDFSGRSNRGLCETGPSIAARRRIPVDVDNMEDLPMKLGCELHIPLGSKDGPRVTLRFNELGDFHPDQIFDRLEVFQKLKTARKLLQDPATFAEAASQVRSWAAGRPEQARPEDAQVTGSPAQQERDSDTIERLLGKKTSPEPASASAGRFVDIEALIHEVVKPYIVPAPDPQQAELVAQVDQAIGGQMRAILHNPDFQELEAAWRMLEFLITHVETDETLKLYLIDVSKAELVASFLSSKVSVWRVPSRMPCLFAAAGLIRPPRTSSCCAGLARWRRLRALHCLPLPIRILLVALRLSSRRIQMTGDGSPAHLLSRCGRSFDARGGIYRPGVAPLPAAFALRQRYRPC